MSDDPKLPKLRPLPQEDLPRQVPVLATAVGWVLAAAAFWFLLLRLVMR